MSTFVFNINTDATVQFTNKLEALRKSALPVAIRGTLNDAAFVMKKTEMPKQAKRAFIERQANFFKANSRVEMATGFDINHMVATMGMVESGLQNKSTNYAVKDLEQQEGGGTIDGRSFKPLPAARRGGRGVTRANARISQIKNIVDAKGSRGANKMQQFIRASLHAGKGGYVLGGRRLWKVTNIRRVGRNIRFTRQDLYSFTKSGTAHVKATGFIRKAALEVQKEMEFFYRLQAQKQFSKVFKVRF